LQHCGAEFATSLIRKKFNKFDEQITSIVAGRQWEDVDIWAKVNDKYFIIIEDKTNTREHSNQLKRYKDISEKWCKEHNYDEPVCIYLKTGNESQQNLDKVTAQGYFLFDRKDFIDLLNSRDINNEIFKDFRDRLIKLEASNNEWENKLIKSWNGNDWQGFFQYLEKNIKIIGWGYVNNPSGGFWGATLNWDCYGIYPLYLQIEQHKLCFKICTDPKELGLLKLPEGITPSKIRTEIYQIILDNAKECGYTEIEKPDRFGHGRYMTVAVVDSKDWLGDREANIEKDSVIKNLKKYLDFLQKIYKTKNGA
jgi:hypothetical protein